MVHGAIHTADRAGNPHAYMSQAIAWLPRLNDKRALSVHLLTEAVVMGRSHLALAQLALSQLALSRAHHLLLYFGIYTIAVVGCCMLGWKPWLLF